MHTSDIVDMKKRKPRTEAQKRRRRELQAARRPTPVKLTVVLTPEEAAARKKELNKEWAKKDYARRRQARAAEAKTIPTGFCNCPYCFDRVLVYGNGEEIVRASKEVPRIAIVLEDSGVKVNVPEIPKRVCGTCTRDLWYFEQYGKYPKGSVFWELMVYDERLR